MVPNQKDVLADYLCDMLGGSPKETSSKSLDESATEDSSEYRANAEQQTSEAHSETAVGVKATSFSSDHEPVVDSKRSDVQDALETAVKRKALSSAVAVLEEDIEIEWTPEWSSELDKISYQIDRDKQLTCLMDLVHQPLNSLTLGEQSLALFDLLALLKQLPESKLKNLLREQYDKVELVRRSAEHRSVSGC